MLGVSSMQYLKKVYVSPQWGAWLSTFRIMLLWVGLCIIFQLSLLHSFKATDIKTLYLRIVDFVISKNFIFLKNLIVSLDRYVHVGSIHALYVCSICVWYMCVHVYTCLYVVYMLCMCVY